MAPNSLSYMWMDLFLVLIGTRYTILQTTDIMIDFYEESLAGEAVVNLSEYPSLFPEVNINDRSKLAFNFLNKERVSKYFAIAPNTGLVYVSHPLDKETICAGKVTCVFILNVAITGLNGFSFSNIASVNIHIIDVNDNSPLFIHKQTVRVISEAAKIGTRLKLIGPRDIDSHPNNTMKAYEMTLDEPIFNISTTENPDGTSWIFLTLTRQLDRETKSDYNFDIIVYDVSIPQRRDSMNVMIEVADYNDNAPVFAPDVYLVSLREDARINSIIVQVNATDIDSGPFGTVYYRFSSQIPDELLEVFSIDSASGKLSLMSKVVYSSRVESFQFVVEAFDGASPPLISQAVVTVKVLNTGNNPPHIQLLTVNEGVTTTITLPESTKVNKMAAFVNVEDSDEDQNGVVTCTLMKTDIFLLAELPKKGYRLLLNRPLDRETLDNYNIIIECMDGGSPPLSSKMAFSVTVTDTNDNHPRFDVPTASASIAENNARNQYLIQVSAKDDDIGANGAVSYRFLEPYANDFFTVNQRTGVVTARAPLDREQTPVLRFSILAVDKGETPKTGSIGLTVNVLDRNDNHPVLLGIPYRYRVSEGANIGSIVGHMIATDLDDGNNGKVQFFFAGSVNGDVPFLVHRNGTIVVSGALDRETTVTHTFTVLARDKGDIPRSNSTQVTVVITDINDNRPVILFPTSLNHSVVITTQPENGIRLGRVIAYDIDEENASKLTFTIQDGDSEMVFGVDSNNGDVYLSNAKHLINPSVYILVIRVSDHGLPRLYVETRLKIEVNYANVSGTPRETDNWANTYHSPNYSNSGNGIEDGNMSDESYVVIVGVISGATLILSGIIIGAIVFVLRSEKRRRNRDEVAKINNNEYVQAPTKYIPPIRSDSFSMDASVTIPTSGRSSDWTAKENDTSFAGLTLSPKELHSTTRSDMQKKVSFSLDESDVENQEGKFGNLMSRTRVLLPLSSQQKMAETNAETWKQLFNPDDVKSDTSGDSGTCDSGRGASDDEARFDRSSDKSCMKNFSSEQLSKVNSSARSPFPSSLYINGATPMGSFRSSKQSNGDQRSAKHFVSSDHFDTCPSPACISDCRHDNRVKECDCNGGYYVSASGRHRLTNSQHVPPVSSNHCDQGLDDAMCCQTETADWKSHYTNHPVFSDDNLCENQRSPLRSSFFSAHRQLSAFSIDGDDGSTTTSGSYTITPADIRFDRVVSHDVIV